MGRSGAITFKGNNMTLAGSAVETGQPAPDFTLHAFEDGGMNTVEPADLKGKPTIISVVPSLDTPVCQTQTKRFNQELTSLGDSADPDVDRVDPRICGHAWVPRIQWLLAD